MEKKLTKNTDTKKNIENEMNTIKQAQNYKKKIFYLNEKNNKKKSGETNKTAEKHV